MTPPYYTPYKIGDQGGALWAGAWAWSDLVGRHPLPAYLAAARWMMWQKATLIMLLLFYRKVSCSIVIHYKVFDVHGVSL